MAENAWQAGAFVAKAPPAGAEYVAAGWIKYPFALDWRPRLPEDCEAEAWSNDEFGVWVLTHIPTGHAAQGICAPLHKAQEVADEFLSFGDWDFTDPKGAKQFSKPVSEIRQRLSGILVSPVDTLPPWFGSVEIAS